MIFEWFSEKGISRNKNCDHLGVLNCNEFTICFLMDAAERTSRSSDFAKQWTTTFIDALSKEDEFTNEVISRHLKQNFDFHRRSFSAEIASYACVLINKEKAYIISLCIGDCRVGTPNQEEKICWQNTIHTNANAMGELVDESLLRNSQRNTLTKSLNSKRFCLPEIKEIAWNTELYIATDGWWVSYELKENPEDDSSMLKIKLTSNDCHNICNSDSENHYFLNLDSK